MSCIPKILELKGDKEFLPIPSKKNSGEMVGVVIEDGGHYKGYDFLVTFNDMGFRCGYVALPPDHVANSIKEEYPSDYDVHGGITFFDENHFSESFFGDDACKDKWLGFDCGHAGDFNDLEQAKKYFKDNKRILAGIKLTQEIKKKVADDMERDYPGYLEMRNSPNYEWRDHPRTKEYVINECKSLIDQLIEKKLA